MKRVVFLFIASFLLLSSSKSGAQGFTMDEVTSYPFPTEMCSSAQGSKIAMAIEEKGKRNVYVAEGPVFALRKLTNYNIDEGQEITSLSVSADGKWVVYVRGGEHSGNRDRSVIVNPASFSIPPKIQVWSVPFAGGKPMVLSDGDYAEVSPKSDKVAFIKNDQVWIAPIDGTLPAVNLITCSGTSSTIEWSPDGSQLAFVSNRTDHSFIGVYSNAKLPIRWMAPSFSKDASPRWSPDGKKLTFTRTPGTITAPAATGGGQGRAAASPDTSRAATLYAQSWAIWVADVATGIGSQRWKAQLTPRGSLPTTDGGANLHWGVNNRIVYVSYEDGWPHLYSMDAVSGAPLLLTPGEFMVEQVKLSNDRKWLMFSANTGSDPGMDIDRRHVARVAVDKAAMELLTPGDGMETYPVLTGDGTTVAMFSATAKRPLIPAVMPLSTGKLKLIGEKLLPLNFPTKQMIIPKQVVYKSPDGTIVHAQLFEPIGGASKKPAIVYVHGGPQRQMLLGWHHMDYYSIDYALNQYLANMGFVVLSVNFRLGIGYGYDFHKPTKQGANYIDVKAGAEWLAKQPQVDSARIGIYGGSHGGGITATALARDSKLFKAGVIIHGGTSESLDKWTSPTMIIHGDDDRNVAYSSGVALVRRFEIKGSPYFEYLAIPGDSHHWMMYANVLKVNNAAAGFLKKYLMEGASPKSTKL